MTTTSRPAIVAWVAALLGCAAVVVQTRFTADMSAFLPRAPTAEQKVLVDQLRDGALSRLLLIGIEGADAPTRAGLSVAMAQALRAEPAIGAIHNGAGDETRKDRDYLLANRYLLSEGVVAERFTADGLRAAIGESIDLLASPAGLLLKTLLPRDPTGEMVRLVRGLDGDARPQSLHGAWASADGQRAILLAQTRATGSDIDGQQQAIAAIRAAYARAAAALGPAAAGARLVMSGSGTFAVEARARIQHEVARLTLWSTGIIVILLLLIYRSVVALGLGLLPVASGAVAGVAAVSLGFGQVHGLTLGFGTTLIGEAVDYSIYLFVQSERAAGAADADRAWLRRFWPTIRLGVLTSVCGFAALLASGFPGLAQLGLYSITGLIAAAAVTRFVLPALLPRGFRVRDLSGVGAIVARLARGARPLRWLVLGLTLAACAVLFLRRDTVWNNELSGLSPLPAESQARDQRLRADLGAPDARYMIVAGGKDLDGTLAAAERVGAALQPLVERGALAGYESSARFLPSRATQLARQQALPPEPLLRANLHAATATLPLRAERLEPFIADVGAARTRAPLTRADLDGTALAQAVDALLVRQGERWSAVLPLRAPANGAIDPQAVRAAVAGAQAPDALFIDLRTESNRLYGGYLHEAILLSVAGLAAIVVLLALALRSPARVVHVLAPLAAAVLIVAAGLVLAGRQLTLLHLVGMLLLVAIGSNYALFFDRGRASPGEPLGERMLASLVCANATTVAGFGLLGISSVPVLQAIGLIVGPGAVLALVFSAVLAEWPEPAATAKAAT